MDRTHTVIDLFCGCGGLSLGFEMAGYDVAVAIDNWKDALATYSRNHPSTAVLNSDLLTLNPEEVEKHFEIKHADVIIGGPPCQGFSVAGKRIIDDARNKLYKSFVGFVAHFRPKAFVMENVPNILAIGGGAVKRDILKDFSELGYNVSYKILTASDYGTPQNRRRAFFVGLSDEHVFNFPERCVEEMITTSEALSDLPEGTVADGADYPMLPQTNYQSMMRRDAVKLFNHQTTAHSEATQRIIALVPDGGNYRDLPKELQNTRRVHIAWTRMNSQRPCFTIDTGHRHHFHYRYNRIPTVRECARIQSFPDSFVFSSSRTSQYRQVGNAVPPLMSYAIAKQLEKYL